MLNNVRIAELEWENVKLKWRKSLVNHPFSGFDNLFPMSCNKQLNRMSIPFQFLKSTTIFILFL